MAHLPVIANTFRVTLKWTCHTTFHARSVLHFFMVGATPANVFAAIDAHVAAAMWGYTDSSNGVEQVDVLPLDGASSTASFPTGFPAKWLGVQALGDFVVSPAVLVKEQTGLRGPAHRGRIFLPFPSEGIITDGSLQSPPQNTMQAAWTAFLTAMTAVPCFPTVASYAHSSQQPITSYTVEGLLGTQRRRQQKLRR